MATEAERIEEPLEKKREVEWTERDDRSINNVYVERSYLRRILKRMPNGEKIKDEENVHYPMENWMLDFILGFLSLESALKDPDIVYELMRTGSSEHPIYNEKVNKWIGRKLSGAWKRLLSVDKEIMKRTQEELENEDNSNKIFLEALAKGFQTTAHRDKEKIEKNGYFEANWKGEKKKYPAGISQTRQLRTALCF